MIEIRLWLLNFVAGDMSYAKNCTIDGVLLLREKHYISCCNFVGGSYVQANIGNKLVRFPEIKPTPERQDG